MKTIIRISTWIIFAMLLPSVKAQPYTITCAGQSHTVIAPNSSGLTSPTYSMNPGGLTSSTPSFVVAPNVTTTYTLYTTGVNSNAVVVTNTLITSVQVGTLYYNSISSLMTSNAFTLGCGTRSVITDITVVNAYVNGGTAINYALLSPGTSTNSTFTTGSASTFSVNTPGQYHIVIRNVNTLCDAIIPLNITRDTTAPVMPPIANAQTTLSCLTTSVNLQAPPTIFLSYLWHTEFSQSSLNSPTSNLVLVPTTPVAPNQTLTPPAFNPSVTCTTTLTITDLVNSCTSNTVITIYQNLYKPNAAIVSSGVSGVCHPSVTLTNVSTSGIPPNTFFGNAGIASFMWTRPNGQSPVSNNSTCQAPIAGTYTMYVEDLNNGCTDVTTFNVPYAMLRPTAAFAHTLTGGQAIFADQSVNTGGATSYFWDFGDGNSSIIQTPSHTYLNGGAHLVKLKITNPSPQCADSVFQSVNVSGVPCVANSGFSMVPTATAQTWNVIPSYPWNISAVSWNWGDGTTSNTLYTSHQYATAGMYNICMTVTVSCSDTSSTCSPYNVYRTTQPVSMLNINVVAPELILGLASSKTDQQFSWNIIPNPNAGEFKLSLATAQTGSTKIMIHDLIGRVVHDQTLEPNTTSASVNTGNLPPGMYLVSLESNGLKVTKRMVVNR